MSTPRFIPIAGLLLLAAGVLRAELPPEAQAAMEKGVLAAQQQDFPLAVKFFLEAREAAPEAPELLYNLGLAESKIPGRELRAIVWFGAYLAANPAAPNAAAVKKQMDALDVANQLAVSKLLKAVAEAATLVPESERQKPSGLIGSYSQGGSLQEAAVLLARMGDATAALRLAANIKEAYWRSRAQGNIGLALSKAGDTRGAGKCYSLAIKTSSEPSYDLAYAQARAGDTAAALRTAETLPWGWNSNYANCAIAKALVAQGDLPAARTLLAKVEQAVNAMPADTGTDTYKSDNYRDLGVALVQAGEIERARQVSDRIKVDSWKEDILSATVSAQLGSGDIAAAEKTAARLTGYYKDNARNEITAAQLRARASSGDMEGALKAAGQLAAGKEDVLAALAKSEADSGDLAGALKFVALMDERYRNRVWARASVVRTQGNKQLASPALNWIAVNTELLDEPNYVDFAAALGNLPKGSAKEAFASMHDFAESVLDLRELITRMMKLQSQPPRKS